ncbi:MAG TPA: exopolysaccharide biosynthesis polyprenyl glycosylphosphotransferase [Opitutaceae bacterium]|nr:exopolysaccharide biosynthesis polyprenyl glycosylphosphotransferase [Opitutaceae bacterium]
MRSQTAVATPVALFPGAEKIRSHPIATPVLFAALLGDALVVLLALAFSSWLRFDTGLVRFGTGAAAGVGWTAYLGHVSFGAVVFLMLLPHREIYDLHRILKFRRIAPLVLRTAMMWILVCMAAFWVLRAEREVSRIFLVVAFFTVTSAFVLWRWLLSAIVSTEAIASRLRHRVLFVGWSGPARSLAQAILDDRRHPYEIVGYVPLRRAPAARRHSVFVRKLGDAGQVGEILRDHGIDMVILADMNAAADETFALANLCEKEMIDFKVIPSCFQIMLSCLGLQTVSNVPVLGVSHPPLDNPLNALVKQVIDWVGGAVGLLLSAPVIAVFGLLVYLESPGPIIYRQRRLGCRGRTFWIYKIRSMKMNAEAGGKVGWTVKDDPRRLRVGAFMRRCNIDELPQFWNVLKGDMSLVGPRPERPELIDVFKEEILHYNARHSIKPGITGWAQVNGYRGDTDLTERVRCDLYYIENWSPILDLQIMLLTCLRQKNAA